MKIIMIKDFIENLFKTLNYFDISFFNNIVLLCASVFFKRIFFKFNFIYEVGIINNNYNYTCA